MREGREKKMEDVKVSNENASEVEKLQKTIEELNEELKQYKNSIRLVLNMKYSNEKAEHQKDIEAVKAEIENQKSSLDKLR